jgi:hypothetical protein
MPLSVALDDVLEFVVVGFYNNIVQVNNVFHYRVNAQVAATLNQFAAGLKQLVVDEVQNTTSVIINYDNIQARILDADGVLVNGETYVIPSTHGQGQISGDSLPPQDCITFKYLRPDASFRHGFKRFAGVPEGGQLDGLPTSGYVTGLASLATSLEAVIHAYTIDGGGDPDASITGCTMEPVILQKIINGDPISPINIGVVSDVVFDKIGTQNTRKFGRGV